MFNEQDGTRMNKMDAAALCPKLTNRSQSGCDTDQFLTQK